MLEIKKYAPSDLGAIEKMDAFAATEIQYHKGIHNENVICVVDGDVIVGVGFLIIPKPIALKGKQYVEFSTVIRDEYRTDFVIDSLLTDGLIARFHEVKHENSKMDLYMRVCCENDEISDMQFLLEKGFTLNAVIPVLSYDLTQDIGHYSIPEEITIQRVAFTPQKIKSYLEADFEACEQLDDEAAIWFRTGNPSFACFAAMKGEQMVGAISVWNITKDQAATENIFVVPSYRRKNIAKELIATAFEELKQREMKIATLSMLGTNRPAMNLYLSCGYKLYYNLLEMLLK